MRLLKALIIVAVMAAGSLFAVLNSESVSLDYYFGVQDLPLSVVLAFTLLVGALLGMLAGTKKIMGLKRKNATLAKKWAATVGPAESPSGTKTA